MERLLDVLRVTADGVGCEYWTLPRHGVRVADLDALGLVRPIRQRVPRCEEHGCFLLSTCGARAIFAEGREGRAGRKFRLTEDGRRALETAEPLLSRVAAQPLAERILDAVGAGGELTGLGLLGRLLEADLAELEETGQIRQPADPASVRLWLELLAAAGLVRLDGERVRAVASRG